MNFECDGKIFNFLVGLVRKREGGVETERQFDGNDLIRSLRTEMRGNNGTAALSLLPL